MKDFSQPQEVSISSNVFDLMPAYNEIPKEFHDWNGKWHRATSKWFFNGMQKSQFTPKAGIDVDKAFKHLSRVISSWSPKHEHKTAGVAYLMAQWFSDVKL